MDVAGRKPKPSDIDSFPTVKYWLGQLASSGVTHDVGTYIGTKGTYRLQLIAFNDWLAGREFDVRVQAVRDGKIVRENAQKSFDNVEELLYFGQSGAATDVRRIVSRFLVDPCNERLSLSTRVIMGSAIKSYFNEHDVEFTLKYNKSGNVVSEVTEQPSLSMPELFRMLTYGRVTPLMRAVTLVMLHAGLDVSTLADRFNYSAYAQISKHCGTENYREWDLDKCPIPIQLKRVKTEFQHTTFIGMDALDAIKVYLAWAEDHYGPYDPKGPMFRSARNEPVKTHNIKMKFSAYAKDAMVQKKLAPRKNKISIHELRDLLKSTLLQYGCMEWAAEHVIGHKPNSSYTKPANMSPDALRNEYSKASRALNVFSLMDETLKSIEDPKAVRSREERLTKSIERLQKRNGDTMEMLRKANGRIDEITKEKREIAKENDKLIRDNQKLDMEILELRTERLDLQKKLSRLEEQKVDTKAGIEEVVKLAVRAEFKNRDSKNLPAGSPVE